MSDNDLIRRGDALNACRESVHRYEAHDAIDALPAVKPPALDAASDSIEAQAAEIERLRAALAKAVAMLDKTRLVLAEWEPHPFPVLAQVRTTLAELTGDNT